MQSAMISLNLLGRILIFFILVFSCSGNSPSAAFAGGREEPPSPPGYRSRADVLEAIQKGEVELIQPVASVPEGVVEEKDIEYGRVGERSLDLDLYYPRDLDHPVPALIFIHGGAWHSGDRKIYKSYTCRFAERGFVAATVSYRLSGEAPFPGAVHDVKCAVRWMRAHAENYHIDPEKIVAIGASAGGHLAMMIGYSADVPELEGNGGYEGISSRVAAVVDFYGPTDLTTPFARDKGALRKFLGGVTYDENPELYRKASPITYLTPDDPPTLILHGTIDETVPIRQAELLVEKLKKLGIPYVYEPFVGWPHTMDLARPVNERCMYLIDTFLEKYVIRQSTGQ